MFRIQAREDTPCRREGLSDLWNGSDFKTKNLDVSYNGKSYKLKEESDFNKQFEANNLPLRE